MIGGKRGTAGKAAALVLALLAALVLALAGCGGGDDGESATQATQANASEQGGDGSGQGKGGDEGQSSGKGDGGGGSSSGSGGDGEGGSSSKGGDRSIQTFGEEATPEQRRQMIRAVKSYFGALANRDPEGACEWLATAAKEQIAQLFSQAREQASESDKAKLPPEGEECEYFLQHAATVFSSKSAPKFDQIEWLKFRVDGDRGFAIYRLPPRGKLFHATQLEDGGWRVAAIDGSPLP